MNGLNEVGIPSKSFDEIFQETIKLRKKVKPTVVGSITPGQIDAAHHATNAPGHINKTFGRMGSKDNELARY